MDTQTDQVHTLAKHHQQRSSSSSSSSASVLPAGQRDAGVAGSSGSSNSNANASGSSLSGAGCSADLSSHPQAEGASAMVGGSVEAPSESSSMAASFATQSPLIDSAPSDQFTHQPRHHRHHHHHHCLAFDDTNSSPRASKTSAPAMTTEGVCAEKETSVDDDGLRRQGAKGHARSAAAPSSSYPLYFSAQSASSSSSSQERRRSQSKHGDMASYSKRLSSSTCDARDPRSSASCLVNLGVGSESCVGNQHGQPSNGAQSPPSSNATTFGAPSLPLATVASGVSSAYNGATYTSRAMTSMEQCKAIALHGQSNAEHGRQGLLALAPISSRDSGASPPSPSTTPTCSSFAAYRISSRHRHGAARSSKQTMSSRSRQNTPSSFISPNALLHRRLIARSSKRVKSQKQAFQPVHERERSGFVSTDPEDPSEFQEQRRSSTGDKSTSSSSSSSHINDSSLSPANGFQLQPVPASKRRRVSAAGKQKGAAVALEKRLGKGVGVATPAATDDRLSGATFTSISKPASDEMAAAAPVEVMCEPPHRFVGDKEEPCRTSVLHYSQEPPPAKQVRSRAPRHNSAPKLTRTQSLPNLKAKPVLDICAPATHRLALPPRLVEYLSLLRDNAQRHQHRQMMRDTAVCSPQQSSAKAGNASSSSASSSFARNGYCSTTIDSMGNVKSVFLPSLHPPITRQTLKELDLHEILKNPQLRHDIVFDSNVQFRPNFDGERGRKKREFGNKYWYAIQKEVETGCTCTSFSGKVLLPCTCGMNHGKTATVGRRISKNLSSLKSPAPTLAVSAHSGWGSNGLTGARSSLSSARSPPTAPTARSPASAIALGASRVPSRIPLLIQELRAICLSILPSPTNGTDGPGLKSTSPLANVAQTATFPLSASRPASSSPLSLGSSAFVATHHILIAQTLDPHLITQQLQHGVLDIASLMSFLGSILKLHCAPMRDEVIEKMIKTVCNDGEVAIGLRMCFEILELMKLDIANHQLRSSRMYLIETAVDFEIRWFREQLDQTKITLDRTSHWFTSSLQRCNSSDLTRTRLISKAFDDGLLHLVFEPPLAATPPNGTCSPAVASAPAHVGTPSTLSSTSLNHAYTASYPETFQFDAYRLMTFHGDVTDITIVYMLLLLFRQLACSSSNLSQQPLAPSTLSSAAILENASAIASRQLVSVKSEIWALLNDADMEASTSAAGQGVPQPRTPTTPGLAGRLMGQTSLTGTQKLENPSWRKAMKDVVLQIAARAIEVQIEARTKAAKEKPVSSTTPVHPLPPSEETMKLLMSWMKTNLRRGSHLHRLCQSRLKTVLSAFFEDATTTATPTRMIRKEREEGEAEDKAGKRIRLADGSMASVQASLTEETRGPAEVAIQKGGLEPFSAEIRLLSERISKVKTFHLRVFRCLYERIAGEMQPTP